MNNNTNNSSSVDSNSKKPINFFNVLEVSEEASPYEIKKARDRLARKHHSDKGGNEEMMKVINEAYRVLSNTERRSDYDENRDDHDSDIFKKKVSGFLHVGRKLSDEFIEKINFWKLNPSASDCVYFREPDQWGKHSYGEEYCYNTSLTSAGLAYKNLFLRHDTWIERDPILKKLLPIEITEWSFNKIKLVDKKILNSTCWADELPPIIITYPQLIIDQCQNEIKRVHAILNTPNERFQFPNIRDLKAALFESCNTSSPPTRYEILFKPRYRHPVGTEILLYPFSYGALRELGHIPKHTVKPSALILQTEATECSDCNSSFGLFTWSSTCLMCGNANCNDCLQLKKVPEFVEPVQVCKCCEPKLIQKTYNADWTDPLSLKHVQRKVTAKYLALVDELGYADKKQFLLWSDQFMEIERYDLAIQCNYSGNGDWFELALKLIQKNLIAEAKICLNQMVNLKSSCWIEKGIELLKSNLNLSNLVLLCLKKAELTPKCYLDLAIRLIDYPISQSCFILASYHNAKIHDLKDFAKKVVGMKKYDLAILTAIQGNFQHEWVEIINSGDRESADLLVECMGKFFKGDWKTIHFKPDRDHLRWKFLGDQRIETWMSYLINLLEVDSGNNCIPYFRSHFQDQNFMVLRDEFLAQGDYAKMALCHRLITNTIPWEDFAKKLLKKNENACLAALCCGYEDIVKVGDSFFAEGNTSLALRCYMQAGNYLHIEEKAKKAEYQTRLLYLFKLWEKDPSNLNYLESLCSMLLSKTAQNAKSVQHILISILKSPDLNLISCKKMLSKTGLSDLELLGLLESVQIESCNETKKWYNETLSTFQSKFKKNLRNAIYKYSLKDIDVSIKLIHSLTLPALESLFVELKIDKMPRGQFKSICLALRSLSFMIHRTSSKLLAAMNDITEAMLGDSSEDFLKFYAGVVEKISSHTEENWKFLPIGALTNLKPPMKNEFKDRLKLSTDLKMVVRSEEAIDKFEPFDAAMSYIDLCMGMPSTLGIVGGFLSAAFALGNAQSKSKNQNEIYAYRRAIVELVTSAYSVGNARLCPATQLYVLRSGIAILTSVFKQDFKQDYMISESDQTLIDILYRDFRNLSDIAPVVMGRLVQVYDLIYLDLIYRNFMTTYLDKRRNSEENQNPIYQYYLFEGTWKGWIDEEKYSFEAERERTMKALLNEKGHTFDDVESLMNWPGISRDDEGWELDKPTPLNLNGQKFSKVEGIRFDFNTGEIALLLESSKDPMENLFDMNDVAEVMKRGISGSEFTLDPPDDNLPDHPFQEMLFAPDCLAGSATLATMLEADLLLKKWSMLTDISSKAPFALKHAQEGLLKRLPKKLIKKFIKLQDDLPEMAGKIHRFWIQAGDLTYYENISKNVKTIKLSECKMSVEKHRMVRDKNGKLVDTDEDNETDSRAAKFSKLITKEFDNLSKSFPVLARLKELVKLQVLSKIAKNIHASVKDQLENVHVPKSKIREILQELRNQFVYPLSNSVNEKVEETLRRNNVSRYEVSWTQLNNLESDIKRQCAEADKNRVIEVAKFLCKTFQTEYISPEVREWLNYGRSKILVGCLREAQQDIERARLQRILDTFEKNGIAAELVDGPTEKQCAWVPAAFRKDTKFRVYGGVNMNPTLIAGGSGPRGGGGPVGSGTGTGIQHVVRMDGKGQIYGTTTCVDRVTGNTYTASKIETSVRDQWNSASANPPGTKGYSKTYVGYSILEHYTIHHSGSYHFHKTNGFTDCTGANGVEQTYKSKGAQKRRHRCDNT